MSHGFCTAGTGYGMKSPSFLEGHSPAESSGGQDGVHGALTLKTYKGQYGVESDFAFLKDPLVVNDIFLKTPSRIDALDMVLIMTVEPGYGGQSFMEGSYERIAQLRRMISKAGSETLIEVDGGVGKQNLQQLKDAGADVFVIGTSIFRANDPAAMIRELKQL